MKVRTQNEDAMKLWIAAPAVCLLIAAPPLAQDLHRGHDQAAPAQEQQLNFSVCASSIR
jgi:hypothetical protein